MHMGKLIRVLTAAVFGLGVAGVAIAQPPADKPAAKPPAVKSKVKVIVPQDDAELVVEQKKTDTKGKTREFDTPDLTPGERFVYDFKVTWRPDKFTTVTRTASRKFTAGDELTVDLTKDEGNDKAVTTLRPPSDDVVEAILKAARIGPEDVVFEPDCKDARTLIAAAKAGAKRAVGVQPDADKVKAAKEQITAAMLEGKVDVQQAEPADGKDYAQAKVVILYLGEDRNLALRPVLLRDLPVGARVVSYRFKMGDWPSAEPVKGVNKDGDPYEIYTWTVTADDKAKYGKK